MSERRYLRCKVPTPDSTPTLLARTVVIGGVAGFVFAMLTSGGIIAERLFPRDAGITASVNIIAAIAPLLVLSLTLRPFLTKFRRDRGTGGPSLHHCRVMATIIAQSVGGATGVVLVHVVLRASMLGACPWLCERPAQLVNDFVAVFGALALIWGSARRPFGLGPTLFGFTIMFVYLLTASRWHLDSPSPIVVRSGSPPRLIGSVQLQVLVQLVCAAVSVGVFRWVALQRETS